MTRQGQFEVLWQREIGWGSSGQSRTGSLMPAGWTLTKFKYRQEDTRLDPRRKPSSATARGRSRSSWGSRTISFRIRFRTKPKKGSLSQHLLQCYLLRSFIGPTSLSMVRPFPSSLYPASGQVLVKVKAASDNPLDVMMSKGYGMEVLNIQLAYQSSHCQSSLRV